MFRKLLKNKKSMSIFQKVANFLPLSMPQPEFETLRELLTIQNPKDLKLNIPNTLQSFEETKKLFKFI